MRMGGPRDPVSIVRVEGRLVQPRTGRDLTETALRFTRKHLANLRDVDGFLLKDRSPSCGTKDVRVYPPGEGKAMLTGRSSGIFAREVLAAHSRLAVEDEARLPNGRMADRFLTRIFTSARFRGCLEKGTPKAFNGLPRHARAVAHGPRSGGHAVAGSHNGLQGSDRGTHARVLGRTAP